MDCYIGGRWAREQESLVSLTGLLKRSLFSRSLSEKNSKANEFCNVSNVFYLQRYVSVSYF